MNRLLSSASPLLFQILRLCRNDLRHIFRDRVLWVVAIAPLLMFVLLKGVPVLEEYVPVLITFRALILAVMCMAAAILPAYLLTFILLDEKDEQILSAIRVLPLHPMTFLMYRLGFMTLLGLGISILFISFTGLVSASLTETLALACLVSMGTPVTFLFVSTFAGNKVEGLTLLKGFNFVSILPVMRFILDSPAWEYGTKWIPFYWVFKVFAGLGNGEAVFYDWAIGVGLHLFLLSILYSVFRKKVF